MSENSKEEKEFVEDKIKIKKILIPIDFSVYSKKALEYGVFFAQTFDAELLLLNVIEIPEFDFEEIDIPKPKFEEYVKRKINNKMKELAHKFIPKSIHYYKLIEEGQPAKKIIEIASREKVDLIIMATHGHSTIDMQIFGSVAQIVVRRANCPVFTIKYFPTEDEEEYAINLKEEISEMENESDKDKS